MIEHLDPELTRLRKDTLLVFASQRWRAETLVDVGVYTTQNDQMYYVVEILGTKSKLDALARGLEGLGWQGIRVIAALDKRGRQP